MLADSSRLVTIARSSLHSQTGVCLIRQMIVVILRAFILGILGERWAWFYRSLAYRAVYHTESPGALKWILILEGEIRIAAMCGR